MQGDPSASAIRIVINGRILSESASPFARLGAAESLRLLAGSSNLDPVLVIPDDVAVPDGSELPYRVLPRADSTLAEAAFDQWHFPGEARRLAARLILCLHASAPLASPAPVISLYGDGDSLPGPDLRGGRLARALALGGLRGAASVLRMQDVPVEDHRLPWIALPPIVPGVFHAEPPADDRRLAGTLDLPEAYVLVAGESEARLPLLIAGWTWVEGSVGESFNLLIASAAGSPPGVAIETANRLGGQTVRTLDIPDEAWPAVFRGASVLLHGGGRRNAAALRWALASGLPVAAPSTPITDSVLGPAGFLVADGDSRSLGAACLTMLVEDEVAGSLRERGLERATAYRSESARRAWVEALTSFPRA